MKRFMQRYAEGRTWFALFTRDSDSPQPFAIVDIRDSALLRNFFSRAFSQYNHRLISDSLMHYIEQSEWDRQGYFDAIIRVGRRHPSRSQMFLLSYAATHTGWFRFPEEMRADVSTKSLFVCTERGWMAWNDGNYRITSEGRRVLRNAILDERDREKSSRDKRRARQNRQRGGAGDST